MTTQEPGQGNPQHKVHGPGCTGDCSVPYREPQPQEVVNVNAQDAVNVDPFNATPPSVGPSIEGDLKLRHPQLVGDVEPDMPLIPYIPARQASRVSIVGFADGHRDHAPWDADDMEFWGINRLHTVLIDKPWTRWFEIHSLEDFYRDDQQHVTWMKETQIPIYVRPQDMTVADEWGIESAAPYPLERILSAFQPGYFTNTISWLIAMAIAMQFEEIHLYGVDMAQDTLFQAEYSQQRPSCEWLIGLAQGRGIRIVIPPGSDLLKTSHLYGFDNDEYHQKLLRRLSELSQRKEQLRGEMSQHQERAVWFQARISELDGAMQEIQYNVRNLVTSPALPDTVEVTK